MEPSYKYDVALSFAGTQRDYVEKVNAWLVEHGISVFYDNDNTVELWGKNLYRYLDDLYKNKARFCVMFISKEYANRTWTIHESQAAQERVFKSYDNSEFQEYILPVRFDDTEIPGLRTTTGYLDAREFSPEELAEKIQIKINMAKMEKQFFSIDLLFENISTMFKEIISNNSCFCFYAEKDYIEIANIIHDKIMISMQLVKDYIHIYLSSGISENNPSVILFLDKNNYKIPIKILNFSLALFQKPEQNMTYNEFINLLEKHVSIEPLPKMMGA